MSAGRDPFYLVRSEIQESVHELQTRSSRWHGLLATNPERGTLAREITREVDSLEWQLSELDKAIDRADLDPARYDLTVEELRNRRKWVSQTRATIGSIRDAMTAARSNDNGAMSAGSAAPPPTNEYERRNEAFMNDQSGIQQQIMRQQDEGLDKMESQINTIGQLGLQIHDELSNQAVMIDHLDEDMASTQSRLRAARKKMEEVMKKAGMKGQMCIICVLMIILTLLIFITFS